MIDNRCYELSTENIPRNIIIFNVGGKIIPIFKECVARPHVKGSLLDVESRENFRNKDVYKLATDFWLFETYIIPYIYHKTVPMREDVANPKALLDVARYLSLKHFCRKFNSEGRFKAVVVCRRTYMASGVQKRGVRYLHMSVSSDMSFREFRDKIIEQFIQHEFGTKKTVRAKNLNFDGLKVFLRGRATFLPTSKNETFEKWGIAPPCNFEICIHEPVGSFRVAKPTSGSWVKNS